VVKTRIIASFAMLAAMLGFSATAFAHHSMSMYDREHDTSFKATILQFDWINPHTQITFTAPDEHGNAVKWVAEGPGPNRLANHGWSKDTLKPGDQVTIIGSCNKDGSPTMGFKRVILANGEELVARPRSFF
jgi:hypothetical protein